MRMSVGSVTTTRLLCAISAILRQHRIFCYHAGAHLGCNTGPGVCVCVGGCTRHTTEHIPILRYWYSFGSTQMTARKDTKYKKKIWSFECLDNFSLKFWCPHTFCWFRVFLAKTYAVSFMKQSQNSPLCLGATKRDTRQMFHESSTVRTFLQLNVVGKHVGQTPQIQPDRLENKKNKLFGLILKPVSYAKKVMTKQQNVSNSTLTLYGATSCLYLSEWLPAIR